MSLDDAIKEMITEELANIDVSDNVKEAVDNLDLTDTVSAVIDNIDFTDIVSKVVDDLDITEQVQNAVNDIDFSDTLSEELGKLDLGDVLDSTISEKVDEQLDDFVAYNKRFDRKLDEAIENYCQTEQFESRLKELIIEALAELPTAEVVPTPQEIQEENARMFEELAFEEAEAERKKEWMDNEADLNAAWVDAAM